MTYDELFWDIFKKNGSVEAYMGYSLSKRLNTQSGEDGNRTGI